jgi:hypothetical protein
MTVPPPRLHGSIIFHGSGMEASAPLPFSHRWNHTAFGLKFDYHVRCELYFFGASCGTVLIDAWLISTSP